MATISILDMVRQAGTIEVEVGGGKSVKVRGLAGWETMLIHAVLPRPDAPMIPDPDKGSASKAEIPNPDDAGYMQAFALWFFELRSVCIAAATGMVPLGMERTWDQVRGTREKPGSPEDVRAWCAAAAATLSELSPEMVERLYQGVLGAASPAALLENALKN